MIGSGQGSPNISSPAVPPGYRDSMYSGNQHALPWRDGPREENGRPIQHLPPMNFVGEQRPNLPGVSTDSFTAPHPRRAPHPGPQQPPPLLASESTNRSTESSSTGSSAYFSPRTPLEPAIDRALPIPSLYTQKSSGMYENQLPPLQSHPLSPQGSFHLKQSQHDIHAADFPTTMPPIRGYSVASPQQDAAIETQDERLRSYASPEDHNLDPFSALLRAGEIVDRNSQRQL